MADVVQCTGSYFTRALLSILQTHGAAFNQASRVQVSTSPEEICGTTHQGGMAKERSYKRRGKTWSAVDALIGCLNVNWVEGDSEMNVRANNVDGEGGSRRNRTKCLLPRSTGRNWLLNCERIGRYFSGCCQWRSKESQRSRCVLCCILHYQYTMSNASNNKAYQRSRSLESRVCGTATVRFNTSPLVSQLTYPAAQFRSARHL